MYKINHSTQVNKPNCYSRTNWNHNSDNARNRIAIDSIRNVPNGPKHNFISIHSLQPKYTNKSYTTQNKLQNFFKPSNTQTVTGNGKKPPHIKQYIPQKFNLIPNFGHQLLISQGPERETAFLYVRPRSFKEENAESITRNIYELTYTHIYAKYVLLRCLPAFLSPSDCLA